MRMWPAVLAACLFVSSAHACVNGYTPSLQEKLETYKRQRADMGPLIRELEQVNRRKPTPEMANDLAVVYIFSGDYKKAIAVLRALEARRPGLPKTAANLGTALELSGEHAEALHWIKQGIRRDSTEHAGTEWLHVKILEARMAVAKDRRGCRSTRCWASTSVRGTARSRGCRRRSPRISRENR